MSSPSTSLLPFISDSHLLYHAHLLVKSWTFNPNHSTLFLTAESRALILNLLLGRPIATKPSTFVYHLVRGVTLDSNNRLVHNGRPLLCSSEFASALVELAPIPSRGAMQREAKQRYSALPVSLVEAWFTRVGELCIYLTLNIVPEGAKEYILDSHLYLTVTPLSQREQKGVSSLACTPAGSTISTTPTISSTPTTTTQHATLPVSPSHPACPRSPGDSTPEPATCKDANNTGLAVREDAPLSIDGEGQDGLPASTSTKPGDGAKPQPLPTESISPPPEVCDVVPSSASHILENFEAATDEPRNPVADSQGNALTPSQPSVPAEALSDKRARDKTSDNVEALPDDVQEEDGRANKRVRISDSVDTL